MLYQEEDLEIKWNILTLKLKETFGNSPDLNGVLFLIGVNELGHGPNDFKKEAKQDLIHIATCKILSLSGYYTLEGQDQEGWPIWKLEKPIPNMDTKDQEKFLKWHAIEYFENE